MLRFVSGLTGGGKSKFMTNQVIEYLRFDDRPILYYMALKLDPWVNVKGTSYPGLVWTLQNKFGLDPDEVRRRLVPLQESQLGRFWAWRPKVIRTPFGLIDKRAPVELELLPPSADGKFRYDGQVYGGAIYVIDEAHEFFKKKDFAKVSDEGLSWASQNRRAGDEAWLMSQRADLVAKPFRDQSVECYWMTNRGHQVIYMFRQPARITYHLYLTTPPGPEPPLRSGELTFKNDYLNGCYDTAAGASVSGGAADIGWRPKGISWRWIPVGLVGICVALYFLWIGFLKGASALGSKTARVLSPTASGPARPGHATNLAPTRSQETVGLLSTNLPVGRSQETAKTVRPEVPEPDRLVTGLVGRPGAYTIYLKSGEMIPTPNVVSFGRSFFANGREWHWAR